MARNGNERASHHEDEEDSVCLLMDRVKLQVGCVRRFSKDRKKICNLLPPLLAMANGDS